MVVVGGSADLVPDMAGAVMVGGFSTMLEG